MKRTDEHWAQTLSRQSFGAGLAFGLLALVGVLAGVDRLVVASLRTSDGAFVLWFVFAIIQAACDRSPSRPRAPKLLRPRPGPHWGAEVGPAAFTAASWWGLMTFAAALDGQALGALACLLTGLVAGLIGGVACACEVLAEVRSEKGGRP